VLGVIAVAERMAHHFILEHSRVPGVGQPQQAIETAGGFIDSLHVFSIHSPMMPHFNKGEKLTQIVGPSGELEAVLIDLEGFDS
jgi:hypothetical protein